MGFDISQWTRLESGGIPVWVCPDKPDWFVPNSSGDRLLRELAAGGSANGSIPENRFLQRLPAGPPGTYTGRESFLDRSSLRELWFHVTNRCNQTCTHCLFSSSPEASEVLAAGKVLETASRARDLGCRIFDLTGGGTVRPPRDRKGGGRPAARRGYPGGPADQRDTAAPVRRNHRGLAGRQVPPAGQR